MIRSFAALILTRIVWAIHGVFGHDFMVEHDPHRLRVVCAVCGYASPGVEVE